MAIERQTLRRSAWLPLAVTLLLVCGVGYATEHGFPPIISAGFEAYKKGGASSAIDAWLVGSPMAGDKAAQSQAATLNGIEAYYGKFQDAELIRSYRLSPSSTLTFMEARYEKGVGFMKFLTFRAGKKEGITQFLFHTQPEQILPSELLYPDP